MGLAVLNVWLGLDWRVSLALLGVPVLAVARSLVTAWKAAPEQDQDD